MQRAGSPLLGAARPGSPVLESMGSETGNDALEHFMPQREGRRVPRWQSLLSLCAAMLCLLTTAAVCTIGTMCFAFGDASCYLYIGAVGPDPAKTPTYWWRLLVTAVWISSFIALWFSCKWFFDRALRARRASRLRKRVLGALGGSSSRSEVQRKLMHGLKGVMNLVHDPSLKVSLSFESLSYHLRDGTYVLSDASGEIASDQVTVVMGPSGCGKSTLLKLLAGKLQPQRGVISLNGKPGSVREMSKLIAFVPQDDIMLTSLTVMENLQFAASLRLPASIPSRQRDAWVHMIVDLLGLTQSRHTIIGDERQRGLSGGQRKRVNVGIELASDPSLIFLDEPTSGLDSTAALALMRCLHRLSRFGVSVCAVLHQPRLQVFEMAHQLLLLDSTGRTAYMGATAQAEPYFRGLGYRLDSRENVADQLLDVVSGVLQGQEPVALAASWISARAQQALQGRSSGASGVCARSEASPGDALAGTVQASSDGPGGVSIQIAGSAGGVDSPMLPESPSAAHTHRERSTAAFGFLDRWLGEDAGQTRLERRLQESGGRITSSVFRQIPLFVWRSATQLERGSFTIVRDICIVCIAGCMLGFLFEGTYEKARCDGAANLLLGRRLPDGKTLTKGMAQNVVNACKEQHWGRRSWFERPAFYCYDELHKLLPGLPGDIDSSLFHGVWSGYEQALTLALLATAITSMQVSLNLLGAERPVFWRESRHYSVAAYLIGKNVAFLPLTMAYPFCFTVFLFQLVRPYAPFQAFYFVFLLVEWVGEGIGQFISILLNSSRQLAAGVAALLFTVLTGSFPLLSGMGTFFNVVSFSSLCRWGMVALYSIEFTPWYMGGAESYVNATGHLAPVGCCSLHTRSEPFPYSDLIGILEGKPGASLPVQCERPSGNPPSSLQAVIEILSVRFGYNATVLNPECPSCYGLPDIYPLSTMGITNPRPSARPPPITSLGYTTADSRFSYSALFALVAIGLAFRALTLLLLVVMDRQRRR